MMLNILQFFILYNFFIFILNVINIIFSYSICFNKFFFFNSKIIRYFYLINHEDLFQNYSIIYFIYKEMSI